MKHRSLGEDFVRLMHLPRPFCVLAFATIGASLSPQVYADRLALTYLGILLGLCFGAYSLDELHGRPMHTRFADRTLRFAALVGIIGGALVNIYLAIIVSPYILILGVLASFFIFAYDLELFGGKFHKAGWFGISWGGLTTFGGYFVQAKDISVSSVFVSAMASLLSVGLVYLTHKFRPSELNSELRKIPMSDRDDFSRYSRNIAGTIADIECYSMILLAVGLMIPKLI